MSTELAEVADSILHTIWCDAIMKAKKSTDIAEISKIWMEAHDTYHKIRKRLNKYDEAAIETYKFHYDPGDPPSTETFDNVRIHIYKEEGAYIAQCLDFDFATQGNTFPDVLRSLAHCVETQTELSKQDGIAPFSDFKAAPHELWKRARCHEA